MLLLVLWVFAVQLLCSPQPQLKNLAQKVFFFSLYNSDTCDALIAGSLGTLSDEIIWLCVKALWIYYQEKMAFSKWEEIAFFVRGVKWCKIYRVIPQYEITGLAWSTKPATIKPPAVDFHESNTLWPKCFLLLLKHRQTVALDQIQKTIGLSFDAQILKRSLHTGLT